MAYNRPAIDILIDVVLKLRYIPCFSHGNNQRLRWRFGFYLPRAGSAVFHQNSLNSLRHFRLRQPCCRKRHRRDPRSYCRHHMSVFRYFWPCAFVQHCLAMCLSAETEKEKIKSYKNPGSDLMKKLLTDWWRSPRSPSLTSTLRNEIAFSNKSF